MNTQQTSWKVRRFLMFLITAFCMAVIWKSIHVDGSEASITAIKYSFWVLFSVVAIYVFGVVTDEQVTRLIDSKISKDK